MDEKILKETLDLMNMMVEGMAKLSVLVTNLVNDGYSNPRKEKLIYNDTAK